MERVFKFKEGKFHQVEAKRVFDNNFLKNPSQLFLETIEKVQKAELIINQLQKPIFIIRKIIIFSLLFFFLITSLGLFFYVNNNYNLENQFENYFRDKQQLFQKFYPQNWRDSYLLNQNFCQLHKKKNLLDFVIICDPEQKISSKKKKNKIILNPPLKEKYNLLLIREKQKLQNKKQFQKNKKNKKNKRNFKRRNYKGRKLQQNQQKQLKVNLNNKEYSLQTEKGKSKKMLLTYFIIYLIILVVFIQICLSINYIISKNNENQTKIQLQKLAELENKQNELISMKVGKDCNELIFYVNRISKKQKLMHKKELFSEESYFENATHKTEKKKRKFCSAEDWLATNKTVKIRENQSLRLNQSQISDSVNSIYTAHQNNQQ